MDKKLFCKSDIRRSYKCKETGKLFWNAEKEEKRDIRTNKLFCNSERRTNRIWRKKSYFKMQKDKEKRDIKTERQKNYIFFYSEVKLCTLFIERCQKYFKEISPFLDFTEAFTNSNYFWSRTLVSKICSIFIKVLAKLQNTQLFENSVPLIFLN